MFFAKVLVKLTQGAFLHVIRANIYLQGGPTTLIMLFRINLFLRRNFTVTLWISSEDMPDPACHSQNRSDGTTTDTDALSLSLSMSLLDTHSHVLFVWVYALACVCMNEWQKGSLPTTSSLGGSFYRQYLSVKKCSITFLFAQGGMPITYLHATNQYFVSLLQKYSSLFPSL